MISTIIGIMVAIVGYLVAFVILVVSFVGTMVVLLIHLAMQFVSFIIPIIEKIF